ncbi:phosphatidate cytidylyltransferase [Nocardioidaceae bacterium]|nr:phosphatidate cytidylyltransferase [Nocardioidaceae bacterium]
MTPADTPPPPVPADGGSGAAGGRDLPRAVASGVGLGALVLLSLLFVEGLFTVVVAVAMCLACWEFSRGFAERGIDLPRIPLYAACVAIVGGAYLGGTDVHLATTAVSALGTLLWLMRRGIDGFVRNATASLFTITYVPFLAGFVALLLREPEGLAAVIVFIAVTVSSDIGGYFAGSRFGRHALAPNVSPKKSWEGAAGSVLLATAVAVWLVMWLLEGDWWVGLLLGPATVVTATLGDLVISVIKRDLGIKDMSRIIPGHGGLMDRLDSLLATVAPAWIVLHFAVL